MNSHAITSFLSHMCWSRWDRLLACLPALNSRSTFRLRPDFRDGRVQCVLGMFGTSARRVSLTIPLLHARFLGSILTGLVCIFDPLALGLPPSGLKGWTHTTRLMWSWGFLFRVKEPSHFSQGAITQASITGEDHNQGARRACKSNRRWCFTAFVKEAMSVWGSESLRVFSRTIQTYLVNSSLPCFLLQTSSFHCHPILV